MESSVRRTMRLRVPCQTSVFSPIACSLSQLLLSTNRRTVHQLLWECNTKDCCDWFQEIWRLSLDRANRGSRSSGKEQTSGAKALSCVEQDAARLKSRSFKAEA